VAGVCVGCGACRVRVPLRVRVGRRRVVALGGERHSEARGVRVGERGRGGRWGVGPAVSAAAAGAVLGAVLAVAGPVSDAGAAACCPGPDLSEFAGAETLKVCDEGVGSGAEAKSGDLIRANYRGRLANAAGTEFDSSFGRGRPLTFKVGAGEVIQGWDKGILGVEGKVDAMRVGGRRSLVIPSSLGYGKNGAGCRGLTPEACVIPPDTTLVFDVELVDIVG